MAETDSIARPQNRFRSSVYPGYVGGKIDATSGNFVPGVTRGNPNPLPGSLVPQPDPEPVPEPVLEPMTPQTALGSAGSLTGGEEVDPSLTPAPTGELESPSFIADFGKEPIERSTVFKVGSTAIGLSSPVGAVASGVQTAYDRANNLTYVDNELKKRNEPPLTFTDWAKGMVGFGYHSDGGVYGAPDRTGLVVQDPAQAKVASMEQGRLGTITAEHLGAPSGEASGADGFGERGTSTGIQESRGSFADDLDAMGSSRGVSTGIAESTGTFADDLDKSLGGSEGEAATGGRGTATGISESTGSFADDLDRSEPGGGGASSGGDEGGCVIATELLAQGIWTGSDRRRVVEWCVRTQHGRAIGEAARRGYRHWARKAVRMMKRSRRATAFWRWAFQAFADQVTGRRKSIAGTIVTTVGYSISAVLGIFTRKS